MCHGHLAGFCSFPIWGYAAFALIIAGTLIYLFYNSAWLRRSATRKICGVGRFTSVQVFRHECRKALKDAKVLK